MRLFFCLELGEEVREGLGQVAARLRGRLGPGSWVRVDNYHVTVRFVGEVEEGQLPALGEVGAAAAVLVSPFTLKLRRLGAFPSPSRGRVLWVGPDQPVPEFLKLSERIEDGLSSLGFPREEKESVPHVTLARFSRPRDLREALADAKISLPLARLSGLTLMRSDLLPQGAVYTAIARWPFPS